MFHPFGRKGEQCTYFTSTLVAWPSMLLLKFYIRCAATDPPFQRYHERVFYKPVNLYLLSKGIIVSEPRLYASQYPRKSNKHILSHVKGHASSVYTLLCLCVYRSLHLNDYGIYCSPSAMKRHCVWPFLVSHQTVWKPKLDSAIRYYDFFHQKFIFARKLTPASAEGGSAALGRSARSYT